jgi:hypothetical protein
VGRINIKNVSPFGELDVPLLRRIVERDEVIEVDEEHARLLLIQPFHYAPADAAAEAFLKALTPPEPEGEGEVEPESTPAPQKALPAAKAVPVPAPEPEAEADAEEAQK